MGFGMTCHRKNLEARMVLLTHISLMTGGGVQIEPEHIN
jgi:hypothetical protein